MCHRSPGLKINGRFLGLIKKTCLSGSILKHGSVILHISFICPCPCPKLRCDHWINVSRLLHGCCFLKNFGSSLFIYWRHALHLEGYAFLTHPLPIGTDFGVMSYDWIVSNKNLYHVLYLTLHTLKQLWGIPFNWTMT